MRIVTSTQMKQIEENSLAYDMTYQRLMENAGSAAAAFIRRTFSLGGLRILVFCAKGNNGGDGLVVARKLCEDGADVVVVLLDGAPTSPEAMAMYNTVLLMKVPVLEYGADRGQVLDHLAGADIIVDAICGTGFHGRLRDLPRDACQGINDAIAAVISLDIPTGAECDTGLADPDAVRADFTIIFDSRKPAHILPATSGLCGIMELVDIGIPPQAHAGVTQMFGTLETPEIFQSLPPRPADSHKGSFGTLLNLSGSQNFKGAATLSTLGALRCGAGIVTVASTGEVCAATAAHLLEPTYLPLAASATGGIDFEVARSALAEPLSKATAVLIGCGLGDTLHTQGLVEYVLERANCPVVVDADGINALARNIHVLQKASAPIILTPHPGEMARLCGVSAAEIGQDRQGFAMSFARDHGVTLVLKGTGTIIASPGGGLYLNQTGNPGLAKGGSGDILAGMLGAFLAQGLEPVKAACCAVHLHGLAADRTAARRSQYAMLPHELLEDLAGIFLEHGR